MTDAMCHPASPNEIADTPLARILAHPYEIALHELGELQAESMRFIALRAAKDIELARGCRACTTPSELVGLGCAFVVESIEDYVRAGMKLLAMTAANFESSASSMI